MGGVPASNFHGSSLGVNPSLVTLRIISPPVRNGGVASRTSVVPQSTPMPVGPHILWPVKATKSAPQACTSVARWGTYCEASTTAMAPASWAARTSRSTGSSVPSTFDMAAKVTILAPSTSRSRSVRSRCPSGRIGIQRSSMPSSSWSWCQGTMLAWCSSSVSTTASPACRLARPQALATRLSASVAFLVNTTSRECGAPMNRATLARAPSRAAVASSAMR